jgi:ElaA protein
MEEQISFATKWFGELTAQELYDALTLRQQVFCVEQNCVYNDCDGADPLAAHLLGRAPSGELVAYARLFACGIKYSEASIGRVVTSLSARRTGIGRALMVRAIVDTRRLAPGATIRIGAQRYIERFYASLGFVVASEPYLEDGIPHVEMLLTLPA